MMNRRTFHKSLLSLVGTTLFCGTGAEKKPNILFLLSDDHRWNAMGCMGNSIVKTPNLDRLASRGFTFTNHFCTTSICMTSRAGIFSGLYARAHTINRFDVPFTPEQFSKTYPALLKKAGYRTGFVGKWGLGGDRPESEFDYFNGFSGQGHYFPEGEGSGKHLTTVISDNAVEFMESCTGDQPFCLSVSFKSPHVQDEDPRQFLYDPQYEDLYKTDEIPVPETGTEEAFANLPKKLQTSEARRRWKMRFSTPEKYQESVKSYYRLITGMDRQVGRMRDVLKKLGLDKNTVIIYTSDNGFYLGEHGLAGKWFMHEESVRLPLIIYDPRRSDGGKQIDKMTLNIDMAPTMLDIAGVPIPVDRQGKSAMPLIKDPDTKGRSEWFYEHTFDHGRIPKSEGVYTKEWKYIRYIDKDPVVEELYNLAKDPHEKRNLANEHYYEPVLIEMRGKWRAWRDGLEDWRPNVKWQNPA